MKKKKGQQVWKAGDGAQVPSQTERAAARRQDEHPAHASPMSHKVLLFAFTVSRILSGQPILCIAAGMSCLETVHDAASALVSNLDVSVSPLLWMQ